MPTYTPNYSFEQPQVGGDVNVWGGKINTVLGQIDTEIKARADAIATINTTISGLPSTYVKLNGDAAMTQLLTVPSTITPTADGHVIYLNYLNTTLDSYALKENAALSGVPTAPTASGDTNTTQIATTAYVVGQGYLKASTASSNYAPIASPTFTGTPTAPTAAGGTNTTQIATTAFVTAAIAAGGWKIGAYRTTDAAARTSTTLANDGVLVFTPPANKNCLIRAHIYATGGSSGIKAALSGAAAANQIALATISTVNGSLVVIGYYASNASPSAVNLQWALNSGSNSTIVKAGSFIEYITV